MGQGPDPPESHPRLPICFPLGFEAELHQAWFFLHQKCWAGQISTQARSSPRRAGSSHQAALLGWNFGEESQLAANPLAEQTSTQEAKASQRAGRRGPATGASASRWSGHGGGGATQRQQGTPGSPGFAEGRGMAWLFREDSQDLPLRTVPLWAPRSPPCACFCPVALSSSPLQGPWALCLFISGFAQFSFPLIILVAFTVE